MTTVDITDAKPSVQDVSRKITQKVIQKEDDNIFAASARKAGMNMFADFLRDDWSANTARKAGFENFANWLDNKTADGAELNDKNFFSNLAREAIKHPVITIATIATTVFLGKNLAKSLTAKNVLKNTNNAVSSVAAAPAPVVTSAPKLTLEQLNELVDEGLKYERGIDFANLELFKDLTPKERQKLMNHFNSMVKQQDLLSFAGGSTPGIMEYSVLPDIFDGLRSDTVRVIESLNPDVGTLILNQEAAKKIITSNKAFFAQRLGLPETTSVENIFSLVSKPSCGPLSETNTYLDLKMLLIGGLKKNATFAQILEDINIAEKYKYMDVGFNSFHSKAAKGLDSFKQALIDSVNSSKSSYSKMPQSCREEILKTIDSITPKEYARRLGEPIDFFQGKAYETQRYNALQNLATKLKKASETGATISFA